MDLRSHGCAGLSERDWKLAIKCRLKSLQSSMQCRGRCRSHCSASCPRTMGKYTVITPPGSCLGSYLSMLETLKLGGHWMALRRGVSADTPHVSSCRRLWCRSRGGELSMCCLNRPGLCHQLKPLSTQLSWPDFVQGCRDPDHTLLGAESHSHVVVHAKH
jgi:hypothetical protein